MTLMVILEWIDVKKSKPQLNEYVIVTNGDFVSECTWNGNGFYYVEGCMSEAYEMHDATYWMEFPLPPK